MRLKLGDRHIKLLELAIADLVPLTKDELRLKRRDHLRWALGKYVQHGVPVLATLAGAAGLVLIGALPPVLAALIGAASCVVGWLSARRYAIHSIDGLRGRFRPLTAEGLATLREIAAREPVVQVQLLRWERSGTAPVLLLLDLARMLEHARRQGRPPPS